jgi:Domain of unknown function (DUF4419)
MTMPVTFKVNDVSKKEVTTPDLHTLKKAFEGRGKFESFAGPPEVVNTHLSSFGSPGPQNGLWVATQYAFSCHRPLVLSPDHIWLAIAKVAARYITDNAEKLRKKLVDFDGTKTLEVRRDDFVKGSAENPWPQVFQDFATQIDSNVEPDVLKTFVCDFSTTGEVERAASLVQLMDATSRYFKYEFSTLSGIPEVTLLGTKEDWFKMQRKAIMLEDYEMGPWIDLLLPFLDEIYHAAKGEPNLEWWQSFYKEFGASGGPYIDGHLKILFPKKDLSVPQTLYATGIPHSVSGVPFIWKYFAQEFRMRFVAGLPFATMTPEGALTPAASWAVEEL